MTIISQDMEIPILFFGPIHCPEFYRTSVGKQTNKQIKKQSAPALVFYLEVNDINLW